MEDISSLFNKVSVSDIAYAEELQFQEVLDASLRMYNISHAASSSASKILCKICFDEKKEEDMFGIKGCSHSFCSDCVSRHVGAKLQENIVFICCPGEGCKSTIDPESLGCIMPGDVVARWLEALNVSAILASRKKCYCPHCSEILLDETNEGDVVTISRCLFCREWFCLQCNVPWHSGKSCEEFRIIDMEEKGKEKLRQLAQAKEWKECPNCKIFVEKTDGCRHITCRCKFEFCYLCGSEWSSEHWNCKEAE